MTLNSIIQTFRLHSHQKSNCKKSKSNSIKTNQSNLEKQRKPLQSNKLLTNISHPTSNSIPITTQPILSSNFVEEHSNVSLTNSTLQSPPLLSSLPNHSTLSLNSNSFSTITNISKTVSFTPVTARSSPITLNPNQSDSDPSNSHLINSPSISHFSNLSIPIQSIHHYNSSSELSSSTSPTPTTVPSHDSTDSFKQSKITKQKDELVKDLDQFNHQICPQASKSNSFWKRISRKTSLIQIKNKSSNELNHQIVINSKQDQLESKTEIDQEVVQLESKTEIDQEVVQLESKTEIDQEVVQLESKTEIDQEVVQLESKTEIDQEVVQLESIKSISNLNEIDLNSKTSSQPTENLIPKINSNQSNPNLTRTRTRTQTQNRNSFQNLSSNTSSELKNQKRNSTRTLSNYSPIHSSPLSTQSNLNQIEFQTKRPTLNNLDKRLSFNSNRLSVIPDSTLNSSDDLIKLLRGPSAYPFEAQPQLFSNSAPNSRSVSRQSRLINEI